MIDIKAQFSITQASTPAARTATVTGTGFDVSQYVGQITLTQSVGTVTGTTPTLDGKVQDSADNSAWADVAGLAFAQVTSAGIASLNVDTRAVRKFIRYVGTIAGTTPVFPMSVTAAGQLQAVG